MDPISPDQVTEKILTMISDIAHCDKNQINEDTNLITDLGLDSLDRLNLLCDIESEFDIYIDFNTGTQCFTAKDLGELVRDSVSLK